MTNIDMVEHITYSPTTTYNTLTKPHNFNIVASTMVYQTFLEGQLRQAYAICSAAITRLSITSPNPVLYVRSVLMC